MILSLATRNARLAAFATALGSGGTMKVYPGSAPGVANSPGTELATLTNVVCGEQSGGSMSISADPDTNAAGSGTPGYVRISTSGGTAIAELKAGIASGECNFGREISQGGKVTLLTGVMLEGNP